MRTETLELGSKFNLEIEQEIVEMYISFELTIETTSGNFYEPADSEIVNIDIYDIELLDLETFQELTDKEFETLKEEWRAKVESTEWQKEMASDLEDLILQFEYEY